MSNLVEYAKHELSLLGGQDEEMQQAMNKHILGMVELFAKEGHSGFSANYAINILNALLRFKPLKPLTGKDEEWIEHSDGMFQNKRCYSVFKDNKEGEAYNIDGKVFSCDGGETWYTSRDSRVEIGFPYIVTEPEKIIIK